MTKTNKFEDERFYKKDGWRCKKCSKTFDSKEVYEYHMRKHEDAHVCKVCKEEFKTKLGLDVHMKQHEDDKLMKALIVTSSILYRDFLNSNESNSLTLKFYATPVTI